MTKKITSKKAEKKKPYSAVLEVNNEVLTADGDTAKEAIGALKKLDVFVSMGELTVKKGDKQFSMSLVVPKVRNLFNDEVYRQIVADNFETALG